MIRFNFGDFHFSHRLIARAFAQIPPPATSLSRGGIIFDPIERRESGDGRFARTF